MCRSNRSAASDSSSASPVSSAYREPVERDAMCWHCRRHRDRAAAAAIAEVAASRGQLLLCGKCKRARYCSRHCQSADWESHKPTCVAAASSAPPAPSIDPPSSAAAAVPPSSSALRALPLAVLAQHVIPFLDAADVVQLMRTARPEGELAAADSTWRDRMPLDVCIPLHIIFSSYLVV
jgi:hypothetical protein